MLPDGTKLSLFLAPLSIHGQMRTSGLTGAQALWLAGAYTAAADFETPEALDVPAALEAAYQHTQNAMAPWRSPPVRSMAPGDVITLDSQPFLRLDDGFILLDTPVATLAA